MTGLDQAVLGWVACGAGLALAVRGFRDTRIAILVAFASLSGIYLLPFLMSYEVDPDSLFSSFLFRRTTVVLMGVAWFGVAFLKSGRLAIAVAAFVAVAAVAWRIGRFMNATLLISLCIVYAVAVTMLWSASRKLWLDGKSPEVR